jgi:RHS repeat-associated protein
MLSYTAAGMMTKKSLGSTLTYEYGSFGWDGEGVMTGFSLSDYDQPAVAYSYSFDSLDRPIKLRTQDPVTGTWTDWIKDVTYGPADELTSLKGMKNFGQQIYYQETRTYNSRLQLTRMVASLNPGLDQEYRYSATQNNGQITQSKNWTSGEEVTYSYDALNRFASAVTTGPEWGLSFGYDGFGNRTSQSVTKGSGPASSLSVSMTTNRITSSGYGYDANGNLTTMPYGSGSLNLYYDVENRLVKVTGTFGTEEYGYDWSNRRLWKKAPSGTKEYYLNGPDGRTLGTYKYVGTTCCDLLKQNLYFAGRLVRTRDLTTTYEYSIVTDRLGSVRVRNLEGNDVDWFAYYPYGEQQQATANDKDKFATYFRDATTGLDYAQNRYYASTLGRFTTPDPNDVQMLSDPGSLNRYAYVNNDPANKNDPTGLDWGQVDPGSDIAIFGNCTWETVRGGEGNVVGYQFFCQVGAGGYGRTIAVPPHQHRQRRLSPIEQIARARNQARSLLSVQECADFIKSILTAVGNQPDLDAFLHNFDQLTIIPAPPNDADDLGRPNFPHNVHVAGGVGQTTILHVVAPFAPDLAPSLLHDTFHSLFYQVGDVALAEAAGNPVPKEVTDPNERIKIGSQNSTAEFNKHCDPAKLPK